MWSRFVPPPDEVLEQTHIDDRIRGQGDDRLPVGFEQQVLQTFHQMPVAPRPLDRQAFQHLGRKIIWDRCILGQLDANLGRSHALQDIFFEGRFRLRQASEGVGGFEQCADLPLGLDDDA